MGEPLPFSQDYDDEVADTLLVKTPAAYSRYTGEEIAVQKLAAQKSVPRESDDLVVAQESLALRTVRPLVDNNKKIEAIIDPGCQIIAMSQDVCHDLELPYDPSITLSMQSANGEVDQSLGLARNVPFTFGNLTLYLQVHVIRSPAYDILLGRPFDVLTSSIVTNYPNEDQTLTLTDPNTGESVTVPTSCRGRRPYSETRVLTIVDAAEGLPEAPDFQESRIRL